MLHPDSSSAGVLSEHVRSIDHIGIAVWDLDAAIAHHEDLLGATVTVRRDLPDQGVAAAALTLGTGAEIELISPLAPDGPIARFLERAGSNLHHIAYEVDDIAASLAALTEAGVRLIDATARPGLHGRPVAFLHPSGMYDVLTELIERREPGKEQE